jgi:hypothetical protein
MHEELENFERNQVWELVDPPPGFKPIGTKWVWKNKEGEKGEVVRKKSGLIAQVKVRKRGPTMRRPLLPLLIWRRPGSFYPFLWLKGSSYTRWM